MINQAITGKNIIGMVRPGNNSGKGVDNGRDNPWEGENIKIETIVSEELCNKIINHLQKKYFDRYALIAFYQEINVIRTEHFQ